MPRVPELFLQIGAGNHEVFGDASRGDGQLLGIMKSFGHLDGLQAPAEETDNC
jgi:hypothetical protein